MSLVDRYARAATSSDLRWSSQHVGDIDCVTAAGWAGHGCGLAGLLVRARTEVDRGTRPSPEVRQALQASTVATASRAGLAADAGAVADVVLDLFVRPWCSACCGIKFVPIHGTGHLSDTTCTVCHGTGRRELRLDGAALELAHQVQALIERKLDSLARKMSRVLR